MVQRALENSVPSSDLDVANKQFAELTEKYRALLEATNSLVGYKVENDSSQVSWNLDGIAFVLCYQLFQ